MSKEEKIEAEGTVVKTLPWAVFEVKLADSFWGAIIRAYVSGDIRRHNITILAGDSVKIELTPYDLTQGRITYRKSNTAAPLGPHNKRR